MTWVPQIAFGERVVRARKDGRYGPDDATLWPQFSGLRYIHFSVLRRRPEDPTHALAELWWTPTTEDFIPASGTIFEGVGQLHPVWINRFQALATALSDRIHAFQNRPDRPLGSEAHELNHLITTTMLTISRLRHTMFTFRDLLLQVAEFQYCWLTSLAWIDWMEKFYVRFYQPLDSIIHTVDTTLMGTVTVNPIVAQQCFRAGIPVWLVRRADEIPRDMNIISVVEPVLPNYVTDDYEENGKVVPFPNLYRGLPGEACQDAMHLFGSRFADLPDLSAVISEEKPVSAIGSAGKKARSVPCKS
jgi:hypothetical protein